VPLFPREIEDRIDQYLVRRAALKAGRSITGFPIAPAQFSGEAIGPRSNGSPGRHRRDSRGAAVHRLPERQGHELSEERRWQRRRDDDVQRDSEVPCSSATASSRRRDGSRESRLCPACRRAERRTARDGAAASCPARPRSVRRSNRRLRTSVSHLTPMRPTPRQPVIPRSAGQSTQSASPGVTRALLFDVHIDRYKRIDRYIDYFGGGAECTVSFIPLR
jgi:hypothetical protein